MDFVLTIPIIHILLHVLSVHSYGGNMSSSRALHYQERFLILSAPFSTYAKTPVARLDQILIMSKPACCRAFPNPFLRRKSLLKSLKVAQTTASCQVSNVLQPTRILQLIFQIANLWDTYHFTTIRQSLYELQIHI